MFSSEVLYEVPCLNYHISTKARNQNFSLTNRQESQKQLFQAFPAMTLFVKIIVSGVTAVNPDWLTYVCQKQCTFSEPVEEPEPTYSQTQGVMCHVKATYGVRSWPLGKREIIHPMNENR